MTSPRRFVPTLTDVVRPDELVHVARSLPAAPQLPATAALTQEAVPLDAAALVAKACEAVTLALDNHIRNAVVQQAQAQQLLTIQSLRGQLLPLVQTLVQEAVDAELRQRSPTVG